MFSFRTVSTTLLVITVSDVLQVSMVMPLEGPPVTASRVLVPSHRPPISKTLSLYLSLSLSLSLNKYLLTKAMVLLFHIFTGLVQHVSWGEMDKLDVPLAQQVT